MGKVTSIRTGRRQTANGRAATHMEKLLAEARLKLIETGTRNRLIHTPRAAKRSRALTITGNASDDVFANLVRENKPLWVLAAEEIADIERDAATPDTPRLVTPRTSDRHGLRTSLPPGLLHKRLHDMQRHAKTAEEERGVNILFLALGFLRWYEDEESDVPRDAPLILLPVSLVRDAKRSTFDLKLREDDIATNQALQERLRGDFGLALPDVAETEDWQPSSYFDAVVQGPPGTGKSQTITNIIAAAVRDGQTVLFVAEKMAALNVVYDRLDKVGLGDICLELHSRAAKKRLVAERLDRTLQAAAGSSSTDETTRQLTAARDRLNQAAKRLHAEIGDTGMTPYRALSIQIAAARRGFTPDARLVEEAALWTGTKFAEKARLIERLADLTESVGPRNSHLYVGVRRRSALQPAVFQRQIPKLQALAGKAGALAAYATMVTNYFGLPPIQPWPASRLSS